MIVSIYSVLDVKIEGSLIKYLSQRRKDRQESGLYPDYFYCRFILNVSSLQP